jgi:hypothetical protein
MRAGSYRTPRVLALGLECLCASEPIVCRGPIAGLLGTLFTLAQPRRPLPRDPQQAASACLGA